MNHVLYETSDADRPKEACDRNGEIVLAVCKNCGRVESQLDEPCDLKLQRAEFEQAAYRYYLQRKASGKLNPDGEGDGSLESLVWKRDDGSYGVLALNAAWWAWQAARGLL